MVKFGDHFANIFFPTKVAKALALTLIPIHVLDSRDKIFLLWNKISS